MSCHFILLFLKSQKCMYFTGFGERKREGEGEGEGNIRQLPTWSPTRD